jgi:pilus assembly protein CpaC
MYDTLSARTRPARRSAVTYAVASAMVTAFWALGANSALAQSEEQLQTPSVVHKVSDLSEKLELTTNSSRILTLDKNIPRVQVNNPELLAVTPLSANQVQISAKKTGVTQINLWDEDGNIHTIDVLIYGDARELEVALATQFPHSSIKVYRYSESLVLKGFVDRPDHVSQIVALAEDYAPKVINNISVGGVQQVLLKVRVMEISRTKLRRLAVDWAYLGGSGDFAVSSVSGLIGSFTSASGAAPAVVAHSGESFAFGVVDGSNRFFGFLDALQECRVAKILAEPNLVAVSGRPAQFNVGGEFPIIVPQSLGTSSIEYKKFGTQVDFLPIVLGNGNIRLEVRPRVSEIDESRSVVIPDSPQPIPALKVREVDTAVEMKAGQTFALAGLVQENTESVNRGLPYLSDIPVIGVPFRKTQDEVNEVELLILVTPEFVDAIDQCEVPCGGPGYATTRSDNCDLYCGGHVEVPTYCNPTTGMTACGECGCGPCGSYGGCDSNGAPCNCGPNMDTPVPAPTEEMTMPGGTGYDDGTPVQLMPVKPVNNSVIRKPEQKAPLRPPLNVAEPSLDKPIQLQPAGAGPPANDGAMVPRDSSSYGDSTTVPRPYSPPREPTYVRNTSSPNNPNSQGAANAPLDIAPGLIGPIGYDAQ